MKTLQPYVRNRLLEIWHDRMIPAGGNWDRHIAANLESAEIFIAMMTVDFVASTYCYDVEMRRALERHTTQKAVLIPVRLNECVWPDDLNPIQYIPSKGWILTARNKDTKFTEVATRIAKTATAIQKGELVHEPAVSNGVTKAEDVTGTEIEHKLLLDPSPPVLVSPSRVSAPPFLKYLCNRSAQFRALDLAIRARSAAEWQRPFVFLVHGFSIDSYSAFFARLQAFGLSNSLFSNSQKPLSKHRMQWPSYYSSSVSVFDLFLYELVACISGCADCQTVNDLAARMPPDGINMITTSVDATKWKKEGEPLLRAFLRFWNQWPDVPASARLVICIAVEYPASEKNAEANEPKKDSDVAMTIASLEEKRPDPGEIPMLILPRFSAVPKSEVEVWSERPEIRNFLKSDDKVLQLKEAVERFYGEQGSIPMLPLLDGLQRMLESVF